MHFILVLTQGFCYIALLRIRFAFAPCWNELYQNPPPIYIVCSQLICLKLCSEMVAWILLKLNFEYSLAYDNEYEAYLVSLIKKKSLLGLGNSFKNSCRFEYYCFLE